MAGDAVLRQAANVAERHGFYLASALLPYARAERLDDDALAARLGCEPDQLPALLLCRRPTGEGAMFRTDVEAIAGRFGLSAIKLARLIRSADVLASLGVAADRADTLLAAARDREPAEPADATDEDAP